MFRHLKDTCRRWLQPFPRSRVGLLAVLFAPLLGPTARAGTDALQHVPRSRVGLQAVPFQEVRIDDAFWGPRIRTNRAATIEANLRQCEATGRINNFAVAARLRP